MFSSHPPKDRHFIFGFSPFRDNRQVQRMAELDHALEQPELAGIAANPVDEGAVNLQFIKWQAVEIGQ